MAAPQPARNGHPLPQQQHLQRQSQQQQQLQQQQAQQSQNQHQRGFSFHSNKSSGHKSNDSKSKSAEDKSRMHTHADPTLAMQEMQPAAMALEKSNLQSLRAVQHKDRFGNPIGWWALTTHIKSHTDFTAAVDPDLSNPTRHRFERPLETIRSFEAAIDGTYSNRRGSYARPGREPVRDLVTSRLTCMFVLF